jgi:hypothetical protein
VDLSTREGLQRLVDERVRETAQLEFKRALPPREKNSELAKDLAAMANAGGGTIAFGIGERFSRGEKLHPFDLAGKAERIASIARELIDEPLVIGDIIEILMNDRGEGALVLRVERSERVPHFVDGQAWGRSGPRNVTLGRAEIGRLFASTGRVFLEEFGVSTRRPAAVCARIDSERRQVGSGTITAVTDYWLVLENRGDDSAHEVEVVFLNEQGEPDRAATAGAFLETEDGPIQHLLGGREFRYRFYPEVPPEVRLTWRDDSGRVHSVDQSLSL